MGRMGHPEQSFLPFFHSSILPFPHKAKSPDDRLVRAAFNSSQGRSNGSRLDRVVGQAAPLPPPMRIENHGRSVFGSVAMASGFFGRASFRRVSKRPVAADLSRWKPLELDFQHESRRKCAFWPLF